MVWSPHSRVLTLHCTALGSSRALHSDTRSPLLSNQPNHPPGFSTFRSELKPAVPQPRYTLISRHSLLCTVIWSNAVDLKTLLLGFAMNSAQLIKVSTSTLWNCISRVWPPPNTAMHSVHGGEELVGDWFTKERGGGATGFHISYSEIHMYQKYGQISEKFWIRIS